MRKSVSVFLLLGALLWAGSGITLHRMVCLSSGEVSYSLSDFDCCPESTNEGQTLQTRCCDFDLLSLQLPVIQKLEPSVLQVSFSAIALVFSQNFPVFVAGPSRITFQPPPRPQGTSLHTLFCVYLI
jgi:hypothetical protein